MSKLDTLIESEGYPGLTELLEAVITDSVCAAICMNDGCSFTQPCVQQPWYSWCC